MFGPGTVRAKQTHGWPFNVCPKDGNPSRMWVRSRSGSGGLGWADSRDCFPSPMRWLRIGGSV